MPNRSDIDGRVFRASPGYELVVWDRLEPGERQLLDELAADPSFYGILRPRDGTGRSVRAVDRDTALLFLTLREPSPLPSFARAAGGGAVADLVLDGVLEVGDGDGFVTGGAGASLLLDAPAASSQHRLGTLSLSALRYAAALRLADAQALAARLYAYNRLPLTPQWAERAPDGRGVLRFLDVREAAGWSVGTGGGGAWLQWNRRGARTAGAGHPTHKLYVSPLPDALPEAFRLLLGVLERTPVAHFKVGGDAAGLLRPDKLVLYFDDARDLAAVADALAGALAGIPAHGVPFTAPIDDAGLLSWGMDPLPNARPVSWLPSESWRSWLARELASALVANGGSAAPAPVEPALDRLRRRGVDIERWVPTPLLWREAER
jgi:hypothetical protein